MKLNGKNIITDNDITVTGAKNLGDNLSEILHNQQTDIENIKSNVKWLYKYGGVGSGGGGGTSGSSGSWDIKAKLGGRNILDGGTIPLSSSISTYQLEISIAKGNGTYRVDFTYEDTKRGSAVLSAENGWSTIQTITVTKNSVINITVKDGTDIKSVEATYIVNPYFFSDIILVNNEGKTYQNQNRDIFIEEASTSGLNFKINYDIAVDTEYVQYSWEYLGITTEKQDITDKSGNIILEFPLNHLINENAGLYNVSCIVSIKTKQTTETIQKSVNFNLIPTNLYLKIAPEDGLIYDSIPNTTDDIYSYKTSKIIGLTLRVYFGINLSQTGLVSYTQYNRLDNGIWEQYDTGSISIVENTNTTLQISYKTPGWKKLTLSCTLRNETYTVDKYMYLTETTTLYNWYKKNAEPSSTTYYRPGSDGISGSGIQNFFGNSIYYQVSSSDENRTLGDDVITIPTMDKIGDLLISFGIQYNEINNTNNPIASFNYSASGEYIPFCTLYQNKIIVDGNEVPIFLGKTDSSNYDPTKSDRYHLVQICLRHVYRDSTDGDFRQICVYIDGTLEGAVGNWINYSRIISQVILYPANYTINLLEIANFSNIDRVISDVDINYYHNTYKIKSSSDNTVVSDEETSIIDSLFTYDSLGNSQVSYSIENQLLKLNSSTITQISMCVKVPTLVCKVGRILRSYDNTGKTIFDWLNFGYNTEQDSDQGVDTGLMGFRCPTSIRWYNNPSGGGNGISFDAEKEITGAKLFNDSNTEFYLRLQGSSTMRYKSKNLTLGVKSPQEDSNAPVPLFSPNFKKDDPSTFLPDNAFTLKADVVDSSHSNNVSLGKFINDVYSAANIGGAEPIGELRNHVKTCLEGFPILLFLEVSDESSGVSAVDTEYYYLGVYNFNLGRENYLNLGYMDLSILHEDNDIDKPIKISNPDEYSFCGISIANSLYQPVNNLVVAEVQGNNPMWDFSQYHNSVLFKVDNIVGDTNYMFGDIVFGSEQSTKYKISISNFVKSISAAGNYIFKSLGKNFGSIVDTSTGETISYLAYRTQNTVPDADFQFIRNDDGKTYSLISRDGSDGDSLNPPRTDPRFSINLLKSCILETESGEDTVLPYLDYNSAVYYYTICMAFGLVDSVQKNLNIKTWNGKTFGLYFYDMDTALGTSNSGGDTSYFCFTDYWKTAISKLTDENGNDILDDSGNPIYKNSGAEIFRDHYPHDPSLPAGYDIPSTYLFSIAKYASCFSNFLSGQTDKVTLEFPQNIWGLWRSKKNEASTNPVEGILENSSKFITNYFEGHLKDIPNVLLNLNYRVKYLYTTVGRGFNNTDYKNLKGRQIEKVRDWLNSRFHILDAYFNLGKESVLITKEGSAENNVYEPLCTVDQLSSNSDIQILHDIFSPISKDGISTTLNREGPLTFRVKARNYTPLIHRHANTVDRFLLENENTEYQIEVNYNGNQTSKFGGSAGWTYLDSLNSFILTQKSGSFSLNSKKLEYIEGTEGTLNGNITLDIPSAKTLVMTSPDYSCAINIDKSFYNLSKVDISNSKIQLKITESNVSELVADNIKSDLISLNSCNSLKSVSLNNSTIKEFSISPVWMDAEESIDLSKVKITTLNIMGKGGELIISGSDTLSSLTFSNFSKIKIDSCPNLTTISCNDSNKEGILEVCKIVNCGNITNIAIVSNKLKELDLTNCYKLSKLDLRKFAQSEDDILLPNLVTLKLESTSIKKIHRSLSINDKSWKEPDSRNDGILYLTDYPNLNSSNFRINNSSVEYIKVANDKDKPFELKNTLNNCNSLKRIYGHIKISVDGCFNYCYEFSIHGYYKELDEEDNENIVLCSNGETIKYNNIPVVDVNSKKVYHPLELGTNVVELIPGTDRHRMVFQEGEFVTNISFSNESKSILSYAFNRTSCTIFDIYYVFQSLETAGPEVSAGSCFYNLGINKKGSGFNFDWNADVDNSPNRYLFKDWGDKLTNLSELFRGRVNTRIRIFSTYENESGNTIGGLFYYVPNTTSINTIFYGSSVYTDNKVFTSITGSFDNLTEIHYFNPRDLIDNINTVNYSDIFKENGEYSTSYLLSNINEFKLGNFNNLFKECNNLISIRNVCNSIRFINFDKFELGLPSTTEEIVYSFIADTAIGKLDLDKLFINQLEEKSLKDICQCFYLNNTFSDWVKSKVGEIDIPYEDAYLELHNEMFAKFPNIEKIGYLFSDLDAPASVRTSEYSSFGGKLKKTLKNGVFPKNIISNLTNLTMFTGFFRNCDTGNYTSDLELPGNIFKNNIKLENISRCFQDIKAKIKLTPNGFENCPKLSDVSYLFCNSKLLNGDTSCLYYDNNKIGIISNIPTKLFYHGYTEEQTLVYYGTDKTIRKSILGEEGWEVDINSKSATKVIEFGDGTSQTITYSNLYDFILDDGDITGFILTPVSIVTTKDFNNKGVIISSTYNQVGNTDEMGSERYETKTLSGVRSIIKTINNAQNCFQGQGWITYYNLGESESYDLEPNPYYQPYCYVYKPEENLWEDRTATKDTRELTYMWCYDGYNRLGDEYHFIDEDIDINTSQSNEINTPPSITYSEQCVANYFCPPDLFRYCTDNANITNVFNYTGYSEHLYLTEELSSNSILKYVQFGMTGRICPYLLKPVSNTTSLEGFLSFSPRLSYYTLNSGEVYLIPKTFFTYVTKINNLTGTFKGLNFPSGCKLDGIFDKLTSAIKVDYTFQYSYYNGKSDNRFYINGVFIKNNISSAVATFSIENCPTNLSALQGRNSQQYIDFGINFSINKLPSEYNSSDYKVKHVYDGYSKSTVTFAGYNANNNTSSEFKVQNGQDQSPYNYRVRE